MKTVPRVYLKSVSDGLKTSTDVDTAAQAMEGNVSSASAFHTASLRGMIPKVFCQLVCVGTFREILLSYTTLDTGGGPSDKS